MMTKRDCCLIVGAGSIGERYIRNLWSMGYHNLVVLRTRQLPFRDIGEAKVKVITSWNDVGVYKPVVAFVCNPTALHLSTAMECVERNIHMLVEKPLSHSAEGLEPLAAKAREKNVLVHVGYMMRYHPFLVKVSGWINTKAYGRLLTIHSHWGEYLPDWHPWEDYRQSYAALKSLGGGVALTLSHDIDLSNWLAGSSITRAETMFNHNSSLEVDVESGADFLIQYSNGVTANIHLNYFQKVKQRSYQYIFEDAVLKIDFFKNEMVVLTQQEEKTERLETFDRNELFLSQLSYFFEAIRHPEKSEANIAESIQIINLCKQNE